VTPPAERTLGVGIDLVETERMRNVLKRWEAAFLGRVFRDGEREYCDTQAAPWRHYAARFAVKEAVAKAFGTGIGTSAGWHDIEVRRDARSGAPGVRLHGKAAALARRRGVRRILVSISHSRAYAVAQAVLLGGGSAARAGRTAT